VLKEKLGIRIERIAIQATGDIEPVHRPSFSIGDSLGDIKVALMDMKTRLERIEGCMLSREYFDESMEKRNRTDLVIGKLDEALRVLAEFRPSKPSLEPNVSSLQPSLTEKAEHHVKEAIESLRLRQVLDVFNNRRNTTPKQLGQILGIRNNTATEHLRNLEKLGYIRRVSRGLYQKSQ